MALHKFLFRQNCFDTCCWGNGEHGSKNSRN